MSTVEILMVLLLLVYCFYMLFALVWVALPQIPMFREKYSLHILKKYEKKRWKHKK